jgi:hypothetical protein
MNTGNPQALTLEYSRAPVANNYIRCLFLENVIGRAKQTTAQIRCLYLARVSDSVVIQECNKEFASNTKQQQQN